MHNCHILMVLLLHFVCLAGYKITGTESLDYTNRTRRPYMCSDALLLKDINKKLERVMADMRSALPAAKHS